ncbi:alpha/beta hydrolase [bacterium]|nr:alpha/beta hydrolase [bacterium]
MKNYRVYGKAPLSIAVIHGGPGAAGEMASVAEALASDCGIFEPFQTADSVQGQIEELKTQLNKMAKAPVILIGFSWGAWLCYLTAANNSDLVKKIILISSGPFESHYASNIQRIRLNRLSKDERNEINEISDHLKNLKGSRQDRLFSRFGMLVAKADAYDSIEKVSKEKTIYNFHIFNAVWPEAEALRRSGKLLSLAKKIRCPVTAIHGDYDPHPAKGVFEPLSRILDNFRFVQLEKCGHRPWVEKWAADRFFEVLREEIQVSQDAQCASD